MRLGIVCPLPPTPTGPASYVARMLPALEPLADPTVFVDDPLAVDPAIRDRWKVRHVDERHVASMDAIVYHLANNPMHRGVLDAALKGPPGIVVLHDASLHHLLTNDFVAAGRLDEYRDWLAEAHGPRGAALGGVRLYGGTEIEQFVFDALAPVLDRHLGVITHSHYAASIVEHRCPGLPTFVVPHFAPAARVVAPDAGSPKRAKVVIGHFGYVTAPKRYVELLQAVRTLVDAALDVHLVFVGEDATNGHLAATIRDLRLMNHATVTGWLDDDDFDAELQRVDIAVSLRWPQVGESSGTLASLLGAGKVTVVEDVGSWAELPDDVVVRCGRDSLADALGDLCRSPERRKAIGDRARAYSQASLDVGGCAARVVDAVEAVASANPTPPRTVVAGRAAAIAGVLSSGSARLAAVLGVMSADDMDRDLVSLRTLPPARPGAVLVDLEASPRRTRLLREVWGYEVIALVRPDPLRPGPREVAVATAGGLPVTTVVLTPAALATRLPVGAGTVDVVLGWDVPALAGRHAPFLLGEVNRMLRPTGVLSLRTDSSERIAALFDAAGLATYDDVDEPGLLLATKVGARCDEALAYA